MRLVILLLGPTGSGKSTFVKHATGSAVTIGGPSKPCTKQCTNYKIVKDGHTFVIIDTPGLQDIPNGNFDTLAKIGAFLRKSDMTELNGIIYFHRITDGRLTGTIRHNLDIFRQMCGIEFYPRVAFVTTMWDLVSAGSYQRYRALHEELGVKYLRLAENNPEPFKLHNSAASCEPVLDYFETFAGSRTGAEMHFMKEVRLLKSVTSSNVRKTSAGREVMKKPSRGGMCVIL